MKAVNVSIRYRLGDSAKQVEARDVFQLIAGTSTGGLIALMLGKMNMTVEQCIRQYFDLAKDIFGRKSIRGKLTKGFAKPRYYESQLRKCVEKLLEDQNLNTGKRMQENSDAAQTACAVVCTEHESPSRSEPVFKEEVVCICSRRCRETIACSVCDAAQATSAAATYFPFALIGERTFSDGGFKHNNPSWAIVSHYTESARVMATRSDHPIAPDAPAFAQHGNGELDCSFSRFVNIGTGTRQQDEKGLPRRAPLTQHLLPSMLKFAKALNHNLVRAVVDSEEKAHFMRILDFFSKGGMKYHRLSATHQVCFFKLDDYRYLEDIESRTRDYLGELDTQVHIQGIADEITTDYLNRRDSRHEYPPCDNAVEAVGVGMLATGPSIANSGDHPTPALQVKTSNITGTSSRGSQSSQNRHSENTVGTSMDHSAEVEASSLPKCAVPQAESEHTDIAVSPEEQPQAS